MIAQLVLAAALVAPAHTNAVHTNRVRRVRMKSVVIRESSDPNDAFHAFVRGKTVTLPVDTRPKDYTKETPEVPPPRRKR